jgi:hypothetical protein
MAFSVPALPLPKVVAPSKPCARKATARTLRDSFSPRYTYG